MIAYVKKHRWLQTILWIVALVIAWQLLSTLRLTNQYLLPSFVDVLQETTRQIEAGSLPLQVGNSFLMIIIGFSVSIALAVAVIVLCNWSPIIESLVRTICIILTPLPGVAIMPLIIMVFGIQENAMVVLMVHSVLWPLVINVLSGVKSIPPTYTEFGRNLELSSLRMAICVYLYALMPHILSGLRIGWGRAWRALISAEMVFGMIGNLGGVGYFIYTNRAYGNMTRVMVGVLAVIVIGIFIESCIFGILEKLTIRKWGMSHA